MPMMDITILRLTTILTGKRGQVISAVANVKQFCRRTTSLSDTAGVSSAIYTGERWRVEYIANLIMKASENRK